MTEWIPFSNGTSAGFWQERNCYRCGRRVCPVRERLAGCNNLMERHAHLIGATLCPQKTGNFLNMPDKCDRFMDGKEPAPRRDPGKATPSLFPGL